VKPDNLLLSKVSNQRFIRKIRGNACFTGALLVLKQGAFTSCFDKGKEVFYEEVFYIRICYGGASRQNL